VDNIERFITLPVWLIATVVMYASLRLCIFIQDYEIKESKYSTLMAVLSHALWITIAVFITLPAWAICMFGMFGFLFRTFGLWTFALMIPALILVTFILQRLDKIPFVRAIVRFLKF